MHDTTPLPAARSVELERVFNIRDLGGLPTLDGRRVRQGRIFRSDDAHLATAQDLKALGELGIGTVIDLRTGDEAAQRGTATWDQLGVRRLSHPFWLAVPPMGSGSRYLDPRETAGLYAEMHEQNLATHAALWRALAQAASGATVIHCASGRDRTGIVVALLLSFLRVPDAHILDDYAHSAAGMRQMLAYLDTAFAPETLARMQLHREAMVLTPPEAIGGFLAWLRERHGSIGGYAAALGVEAEVESLRAGLLGD